MNEMHKETHFVCNEGCGGVAQRAGTCQALDCAGFGKQLEPCACEGGVHAHQKSTEA